MVGLRKFENELAKEVAAVGASKPGEGGGSAGFDFAALAHGDEHMVAELPDGVGERGPDDHGRQSVVFGRRRWGVLDGVDGGKLLALHLRR